MVEVIKPNVIGHYSKVYELVDDRVVLNMAFEILKEIRVELVFKMLLFLRKGKFLPPIDCITQILLNYVVAIFKLILFHQVLYRLVGGLHRQFEHIFKVYRMRFIRVVK